jgi:hypothetical protein
MPIYRVKQGDTLSLIAKSYKLANWEVIYNHPRNVEFRRLRPNPNLIYPGDEVYVPERETRTEEGATDQKHTFRVSRPHQVLRIAAEDITGERLANAEYELVVAGKLLTGRTDGEGILEEKIPVEAKKGQLKIGSHRWELLIGYLNPIDSNTKDRGVSGAQGRLKNLGYAVGKVDGIMGPKTKAAIEAFQADEKLQTTGKLDEPTRKALVRVHNI